MSDHWSHYVANMGGHNASIVFDDGIAQTIRSLPENTSVLVTIPLKDVLETRMPTDAEAERLEVLADALDQVFEPLGGYCVGRVTSNAERHVFYYVREMNNEISGEVYKVGQSLGYELGGGARHDPEKLAYFDDLYPDPESRQVIEDMNVIHALLEHGDDISAPRRVDHLCIFPDKKSAQAFAVWAAQAGYDVDPIRKEGALLNKSFHVETHNETAVTVYEINPHSLGHFRKTAELGGQYDGWGTHIVPMT